MSAEGNYRAEPQRKRADDERDAEYEDDVRGGEDGGYLGQ